MRSRYASVCLYAVGSFSSHCLRAPSSGKLRAISGDHDGACIPQHEVGERQLLAADPVAVRLGQRLLDVAQVLLDEWVLTVIDRSGVGRRTTKMDMTAAETPLSSGRTKNGACFGTWAKTTCR